MSKAIFQEQVSPSTPATDRVAIYPKAGGQMYKMSDDGAEKQIIDTSDSASETAEGISELATDAETITGTATDRTTTPANLTARMAEPGAIGGSTPAAGAFTTLSASGLITATGGQIAFPATAVPSADPNTLDDYEEGYYTPTLTCGTSGTITINASFDRLAYTKIGRKVTVTGSITIGATDAPVGTLVLTLPFAIGTLTESAERATWPVLYHGIDALASAGTMMIALFTGSSATIHEQSTTSYSSAAMADKINVGSELQFGFTYFTD